MCGTFLCLIKLVNMNCYIARFFCLSLIKMLQINQFSRDKSQSVRFFCVFIVFSIFCLSRQHLFDLKYCIFCFIVCKICKISEILLQLKITVSVNILLKLNLLLLNLMHHFSFKTKQKKPQNKKIALGTSVYSMLKYI